MRGVTGDCRPQTALRTSGVTIREMYTALYSAFGPQRWWPGDTAFEVAVGAILTQNTNWGNVELAIDNLKRGLTFDAPALHKLGRKRLALMIKPTGYFNVKARRLQEFLRFLMSDYGGSMEKMKREDTHVLRKRLLNVYGIGPETADSILLYALEKPVFVVDAYTRRILERHGIVSEKATYRELQEMFHACLPPDVQMFNEYHALIVKTGKDCCKTRPKCRGCPLEKLS